MDIRQKAKDTALVLKHDKKWRAIAISALVVVFISSFFGGAKQKPIAVDSLRDRTPTVDQASTGSLAQGEAVKDFMDSISQDLKSINSKIEDSEAAVTKIGTDLDTYKKTTNETLASVLGSITEIKASQSLNNSGATNNQVNVEQMPVVQDDGLSPLFEEEETALVAPPPPQPKKVAVISAGDHVRMKLISGVNAPTDGTPYPVLFQLADDVLGPDNSALPLGEARIVAAAQGSLSDSRAVFRLTSLSYRNPDGSRNEVKIDGWVVGEDGVVGMEGELLDPLGKVIVAEGAAGFLEGVGQGLSQGQLTTSQNSFGGNQQALSGDLGKYALGQGGARAGGALAGIIEDRAKQLVPHVRVLSGRHATAVFKEQIVLHGLYDQVDDDQNGVKFVSLD